VRLFAAMVLFLAIGATAETTNDLSDAEIQGRKLAQQLLEQQPTKNLTQNGILNIRDARGRTTNASIILEAYVTPEAWIATYTVLSHNSSGVPHIGILHQRGQSNLYVLDQNQRISKTALKMTNESAIMIPFAGSDFWIADLGLEFFHWPEQKILPNPTPLKRSRSYTLLESINPNPSTNGYSRVLSWIDKESGGILEADAFDTKGKLLKVFEPDSFKKVDGQWELQEVEIRNVQTGSRTRLGFGSNRQ